MRIRDFAALITLGALWGASFVFLRIAAPALGPIFLIAVRVLLAGLVLFIYALAARKHLKFHKNYRSLLILGLVNSALPFTLIATATLNIPASFGSVMNSTTPLSAAVVAALWLKEPFTVRKGFGLALGLVGVVVLVGLSPVQVTGIFILSVLLALAGSLSFGVGAVYSKIALRGANAMTLTIGQQLASGLWLLPFVAFTFPTRWPSQDVIIAVAGLTLLSTAFAYILYFKLMENVGPTKTATTTFLIPAFGILWSAIFLGEPLSPGMFAGIAIILASVVLVTELKVSVPAFLLPFRRPEATRSMEDEG